MSHTPVIALPVDLALRQGEPLPDGVPRLFHGQLSIARGGISEDQPDPATGIHETRKAVKRLRALVRLVSPAFPDGAIDGLNEELRQAGRALGPLRDATVASETLARLTSDVSLVAARPALERASAHLGPGTPTEDDVQEAAETAREHLAEAETRFTGLSWHQLDAPAVRQGLEGVYAAGRERMERALSERAAAAEGAPLAESGGPIPPDELSPQAAVAELQAAAEPLHDWRRRVKDTWYHVQMFEPAWPLWLGALEVAYDELSDALGVDHDLFMTWEALESYVSERAEDRAALAIAFLTMSRSLRDSAERIGRKVYSDAPDIFSGQVLDRWSAWAETQEK